MDNQPDKKNTGAMISTPILNYIPPFYISVPLGFLLMIASIFIFGDGSFNESFQRGSPGYFAAMISAFLFIFGFFDLVRKITVGKRKGLMLIIFLVELILIIIIPWVLSKYGIIN